jgi:hypothetical protein
LGHDDPPEEIRIQGGAHQRLRVFKHDSWAATALYEGPLGLVVCKFNRRQPIGPIPMRWLGWILARRERRFLQKLGDLPNIPDWSGDVFEGEQRLANAVAHAYVRGEPLRYDEPVDENFFPALEATLREMHRRGMAFVDLHKAENVLVSDDGRPFLIDFQIGFALPRWWPANCFIPRAFLRMLQQSDLYHLQKHIEQHAAGGGAKVLVAPPWWIRAHRLVAVPFRTCRRWLLVKLGIRRPHGGVQSEQFVEEGLRPRQLRKAA